MTRTSAALPVSVRQRFFRVFAEGKAVRLHCLDMPGVFANQIGTRRPDRQQQFERSLPACRENRFDFRIMGVRLREANGIPDWSKARRLVVFNHVRIVYDSGKHNEIKELRFGGRIASTGAGLTSMRATRLLLGIMTLAAALSAQQYPPQNAPGGPAPQDQGPADAQAPADQPGRAVARISVLSGDASVTRGDASAPVAAAVNAPLMAGDSLSVAPGATAELQMDAANFARIAGDSQIRLSSLDGDKYQIQLSKGLVTYRVLRQTNAQSEIDTPLVAVHPYGLAAVRVEVAPDGSTRVTVRHGAVDVYTPKGTERINEGSTMMVRGSADDPEFQVVSALAVDQWDTWNDQRDTYLSRAQSPRYASPDVVGTEDLDNYGRWSNDPQYGNVWTPTVPSTWAPYQNGQWVWEDYYGWTWVPLRPVGLGSVPLRIVVFPHGTWLVVVPRRALWPLLVSPGARRIYRLRRRIRSGFRFRQRGLDSAGSV